MPLSNPNSPIRANNLTSEIPGLYQVAVVRFPTALEFYEDPYFRFDFSSNALRVAAVGTAKSIGVYGFNSGSTQSALPVAADADFVGVGGYASIAVGVFTTISNAGLSSDYDDIMLFWIQCANVPVKYRITLMGGSEIGAIVERWDMSKITSGVKITLPN
jgi:hypothetical protein